MDGLKGRQMDIHMIKQVKCYWQNPGDSSEYVQ